MCFYHAKSLDTYIQKEKRKKRNRKLSSSLCLLGNVLSGQGQAKLIMSQPSTTRIPEENEENLTFLN
jgi:hypothetical protein